MTRTARVRAGVTFEGNETGALIPPFHCRFCNTVTPVNTRCVLRHHRCAAGFTARALNNPRVDNLADDRRDSSGDFFRRIHRMRSGTAREKKVESTAFRWNKTLNSWLLRNEFRLLQPEIFVLSTKTRVGFVRRRVNLAKLFSPRGISCSVKRVIYIVT